MEEKEIEELLKESAENIPQKDFSTRWEEIKDRLPKNRRRINARIVSAIALSACVLLMATIMPFILKNEPEKSFLDEESLVFSSVDQEEFYSELTKVELNIIDFSNYSINEFKLAAAEDFVVHGGKVIYTNEDGEEEFIFSITFYSSLIRLKDAAYVDLTETTTVNGATVQYYTNFDALYKSKALTVFNNITYLVEYTSLNNDLNAFLSNILK